MQEGLLPLDADTGTTANQLPLTPRLAERIDFIRRWLVDTGAGVHVVGRQHLTARQFKNTVTGDTVSLLIANGVVEVDQTVELFVDELGFSVWVYVLPDSPPALSVGRLCRADNCKMTLPDGRVIDVTTIAHCPYLLQQEGVKGSCIPNSVAYIHNGRRRRQRRSSTACRRS